MLLFFVLFHWLFSRLWGEGGTQSSFGFDMSFFPLGIDFIVSWGLVFRLTLEVLFGSIVLILPIGL